MDRSSVDDIVVRFDEFELDVAAFELRRNGAPVHTEPMVFDLLHCLVAMPQELQQAVAACNAGWICCAA